MHNEFHELLPQATGDSQHVIVLNVDIRSFSQFSERVESVQAALYIKKFYLALLADYFADATFFKPTGDGMLLIYAFDEPNLRSLSRSLVATSIKLVRDFPTILDGDPSVNFEVPDRVGVGLARGAASCLQSGGKTLDYSGRTLNLASRLMDYARPQGVVFDETFRIDLLTPAKQEAFKRDQVFVRGISTTDPLTIFHTADVIVPPSARKSPEEAWETVPVRSLRTLRQLIDAGPGHFSLPLQIEPIDPKGLSGRVTYPALRANGTKAPGLNAYQTFSVEYAPVGGKPYARFHAGKLADELVNAKVKQPWPITVELHYRRS